ncbi:archaellar assembly protein FlaJ [Halalkalicoccus sp. NIPERK01]|uniref:archaellar assembly protein FlaJ n=1 Tax=Halalkalicoccus sp. NIPERK01 TaxID=3053469 RepID=UPI00256EA369|nr:archaellar assembly protein FlaJ [Halalkalicoccus sp. NIPERK01]MDL5361087.1 archaellar assembly protein FlaJ [Halalkalicoccus sp. NIPERK01]
MATNPRRGSLSTSLAAFVTEIARSYRYMEVPIGRYVLTVLLPSSVVFVLSVAGALALPVPLAVRLPIPLLGLLCLGAAVIYPKLLASRRKIEIENQFHLLVTHMTILATTNIDRMEVFRTLSREEEYGELAREMGCIVRIVDTWNQSLDDACRRRAAVVPSDALADFLDRLAYTLGAGQELSDFLLSEQDVMIGQYVTVYESTMGNIEVMKDLYMSMILSMTFALVFAIVLPILTGTDPTLTVAAVLAMFVFVQFGFYLVIRTMSPHDPIWYHPETLRSAAEGRIVTSLVAGGVLSALLVVLTAGGLFGITPVGLHSLFLRESLPEPLYLAVPLTPLLIPGYVLRREERAITARDAEFPSFIRALGASESAKRSTTSDVLSTLRTKDFGPLTTEIDDLFKRLNMRLDPVLAWRYLAADSQSYLIQKFSEMYLIGRRMGGSPRRLGELISQNMNEVNQLREQRRQAAVTLIGLLYGITVTSAFAFFIGLEVVAILSGMNVDLTATQQLGVGQLIHTEVYDIELIRYLLLVVILFNALLSSIMIRTVDGGNKANSFIHFVLLSWLGCLTAVVTTRLVELFLTV